MTLYRAKSLVAIADSFEAFAKNYDDIKPTQKVKRDQRDCEIAARVWREASAILRDITIEVQS